MRITRRLACGVVAVVAVALPVLGTAPAYAEDSKPAKLFSFDDDRITESSMLARSALHDDVWWTANDSGDSARIFAVDKTGETQAEVTFDGPARDVEAMAIGTNKRIYVGDIGDNLSNQKTVTVYSLAEPKELEDQELKARTYRFRYPDGPHNAETLLINPQTNRLYIVTKEMPRSTIYAAPTPDEMSRTEVNDLEKIGTAPAIISDGTFTPDGRRLLLRTFDSLTVMSWPALKTTGTAKLPTQIVGESLAMGPDDDSVVFGSEGRNSAVYRLTIPTAAKKPAPSETPKPTDDAGSTTNTGTTKQGHSLRWTLIGAGGFAALMAAFTFPRGRRERADALLERQRTPSSPDGYRDPYRTDYGAEDWDGFADDPGPPSGRRTRPPADHGARY